MADAYERVPEAITRITDGLTREDLTWQPRPDANSIAWLIWHLTRQQDYQVSALMGEEQLWLRDGWHARFNRPREATDIGFGNTPEQVAAFDCPDTATLVAYQRAVTDRSKALFATLSEVDLDRELTESRFTPIPTVGVRLVSILGDSLEHVGQAAYVRGLRQGKGWQRF
jgi:hypothetical protein